VPVVRDLPAEEQLISDEIAPASGADIIDLTELRRKSLRKPPAGERQAANDEEAPVRMTAAKKASGKATATVKASKRKRA
jgi:hypothetical protein